MTKRRAPLTFDNALANIAGKIGWAEMAKVVDQSERTVRDWGDPDTGRGCPIAAALKLDLAYQAAGGIGAPMHETYSLMLEDAHAERFADKVALALRTSAVIREVGEAGEALVLAALPGSTDADLATALREVEEGISALRATVPFLKKGEPPA